MPSLFESLGGRGYFEELVDDFRRRLCDDPELGPLICGPDIQLRWDQMTSFFAATCGGPEPYTGRRLRWVHARHQIRGDQFRLFLAHLSESMLSLGTSPPLVAKTLALLAPLRDDVASCPTLGDMAAISLPSAPPPTPPPASTVARGNGGARAGTEAPPLRRRTTTRTGTPPAQIVSPRQVTLRDIEQWTREPGSPPTSSRRTGDR